MASKMEGDMVWGLVNKLGLSGDKASGLVSSIAPMVMKGITSGLSKNGSNDASGILSMLGGGDGVMDMLKGKLGGLFGN